MSLHILNAHTGDKATADPVALRSLDDFKAWLSKVSSVPAKNQILLTAAGKQAKFHALRTEHEVFLYDRKFITPAIAAADSSSLPTWSSPPRSALQPAPAPASDKNEPQVWRDLFEARRAWTQQVVDKSNALAHIADKDFDAVTIIQRGLGVASDNLQNHVNTLETKLSEAKDWAKQSTEEQQDILRSLDETLTHLSSLPARSDFGRFLTTLNPTNHSSASFDQSPVDLTLNAFAEPTRITQSADIIRSARESINDRLDNLDTSVAKVSADANALIKAVEELQTQSIVDSSNAAWQLIEEIEVVAKKISSDHEHILSLPATSASISQMSKMASLQTRNYLPSLDEYYAEMQDLVDHAVNQRNTVASKSLSNMQNIAKVEASFAQVNSKLMSLDLSNDVEQAFDFVSLLSQLPFVYGALLIEAVRRQEWSDKLRHESAILAEDIAEYREEEDRRRKRWYKNLSHLINEDASVASALNFEINLQATESAWPNASRDDISTYLQALRDVRGLEDVVDELSEAAKELDRPTKKQVKKARGFKMGSFHESTSGRGSFLLRDSDDVRAMREAKEKVDEELKSQKSRVRRLEDLLYKHGQTSRRNSGNIFQLPGTQTVGSPLIEHQSPNPEEPPSRKPSIASRPSFEGNALDEKALSSRRIAALEAELQLEKEKRLTLEAEAQSKTDDHARITSEVEESRSTKKDLMENMEAQQQEFAEERILLEDQIKEYKIRLEELEDEMDRILGSRDNEKTNAEAKLRSLESALADTKTQVGRHQDDQAGHLKTLHTIYSRLDPDSTGPIPEASAEILEKIDELVDHTLRQVKDLNLDVNSAKADKEDLQSKLEAKGNDCLAYQAHIDALEKDLATLNNDFAAEKARSESLVSELEDGRTQLRTLRTKFAEGETGSEALRQRVEEQAGRASTLATELAEAKSHVNSLDVELSSIQTRYQKLQVEAATNSKRLEQRAFRDRMLTSRLISTNEELARLLESVGLSMVIRDGSFAIQRASKLASQSASASTTTFSDPSGTTQFDADGISPDAKLTQWMHAASPVEEERLFNAFLEKISTFNLYVFSEAIIKLRRDVEWTGKKWKQEARNYRERYHRAQTEAHEKIAFKSFKEGDLALFLPTRNQATRPWAAFNVGAPHFFLRETDAHRLRNREWLVARISKIEERVVDLSKTMSATQTQDTLKFSNAAAKHGRTAESSDRTIALEDDNPFELSDGLRWYLLDALEEKAGAPSTPGLSKSTVASVNVDVKGSIRMKKSEKGHDASGILNKSLESRRSSTNSKRGSGSGIPEEGAGSGAIPRSSSGTHLRPGSRSSAANAPTAAAATAQASNDNSSIGDPNVQQNQTADEQPYTPTRMGRNKPLQPPSSSQIAEFRASIPQDSPSANPKRDGSSALSSRFPQASLSSATPGAEPQNPIRSPMKGQVQDARNERLPTPTPATKENHVLGQPQRTINRRDTWESLWSLDVTNSLEDEPSPS